MACSVVLVLLACALAEVLGGQTVVSIKGTQFFVNGQLTNTNSPAAGLLLNCRMTQAMFDDENAQTVVNWVYPDTHTWNATRNTNEFSTNITNYVAKGLNAVTIGMQGSDPDPSGKNNSACITTAFNSDGSLKPAWVARLTEILEITDQLGVVVILNLFDQSQEARIQGVDSAIFAAVQNVVETLLSLKATNVILDLADACNAAYTHQMLTPDSIYQLIKYAQTLSSTLPVSTSFPPGIVPPDSVVEISDFILLHSTGLNSTQLLNMVQDLKSGTAYKHNQVPIVINMDDNVGNLSPAVEEGVSWGYYTQGLNNYVDGYCSPPVNWAINTIDKTSFFDQVALLAQPSVAP